MTEELAAVDATDDAEGVAEPVATFLGLTGREWPVLTVVAAAFASVAMWWLQDNGVLVFLTIWFSTFVFGHLCLTASRYVAFPGLIGFAVCLQWLLAPWLSTLFRPTIPDFELPLSLANYLQFALPATVLFWLGLQWPSYNLLREISKVEASPIDERFRPALNALFIVGLVLAQANALVPEPLRFLVAILASVRFFVALAWMLTDTPGWRVRVSAVMFQLFWLASGETIFYEVAHWGGFFVLAYGFRRRWRLSLAAVLLAALAGVFLLQQVKPGYRDAVLSGEVPEGASRVARITSMLWNAATGHIEERTPFGDLLLRLNQGWIIGHVMTHVPAVVPYANGSTLAEAAVFSLVPRALFPQKRRNDVPTMFIDYTGIELPKGTLMGLGVIGEFYANFGSVGGMAGSFLFASFIGWLFLRFARHAQRNVLWWALMPVVLVVSVEPGWNIEDTANYVVKAGIIAYICYRSIPGFDELLAPVDEGEVDNGQDDAATDVAGSDEPVADLT